MPDSVSGGVYVNGGGAVKGVISYIDRGRTAPNSSSGSAILTNMRTRPRYVGADIFMHCSSNLAWLQLRLRRTGKISPLVDDGLVKNMAGYKTTARWSYRDDNRAKVTLEVSSAPRDYFVPNHLF